MSAPKYSAMHCMPRHMPKIGTESMYFSIIPMLIPEFFGLPQPGDMMIPLNECLPVSSMPVSSFLMIFGLTHRIPRY